MECREKYAPKCATNLLTLKHAGETEESLANRVNKELENNFSKGVDFDDSFECTQVPFKHFLYLKLKF